MIDLSCPLADALLGVAVLGLEIRVGPKPVGWPSRGEPPTHLEVTVTRSGTASTPGRHSCREVSVAALGQAQDPGLMLADLVIKTAEDVIFSVFTFPVDEGEKRDGAEGDDDG
jgi:hypothetical protein